MVTLSKVLQFHLTDSHQQAGKLVDLAATVAADDYPPITRLFFLNSTKQAVQLPWDAVRAVDWQGQSVQAPNLEAGRPVPPEVALLGYPEDTAGGIMTNDMITAPPGLTVGQVRQELPERLKETKSDSCIYVVAEETGQLQGVLSLWELVVAHEACPLDEIMNPQLETISVREPAAEAAQRVMESRLAALPVVDGQGQLLGAVTVEAAVAELVPRAFFLL